MAAWKIKEVCCNSLNELNIFIEENNISPSNVLKYETVFDQIKQSIKYVLTYWALNKKDE